MAVSDTKKHNDTQMQHVQVECPREAKVTLHSTRHPSHGHSTTTTVQQPAAIRPPFAAGLHTSARVKDRPLTPLYPAPTTPALSAPRPGRCLSIRAPKREEAGMLAAAAGHRGARTR